MQYEADRDGLASGARGTNAIVSASVVDLARVRARQPAALAEFFDRYFDRLYALAYRLVGERALAEDVTQEALLRVHRAIDTLDPALDPWPWIAQILTNVCRDHWGAATTRHGRQSFSLQEHPDLEGELPEAPGTPETITMARQEAVMVQRALDRLPASGRLVVLLHDYQGLGHEEIAEITGSSHTAVRQQYRRALVALGRLLRTMLT